MVSYTYGHWLCPCSAWVTCVMINSWSTDSSLSNGNLLRDWCNRCNKFLSSDSLLSSSSSSFLNTLSTLSKGSYKNITEHFNNFTLNNTHTWLINVSCLACSTDNKSHNDKVLASVHSWMTYTLYRIQWVHWQVAM